MKSKALNSAYKLYYLCHILITSLVQNGKWSLVKNVVYGMLSSPVTDPSAISSDVPVLINPYLHYFLQVETHDLRFTELAIFQSQLTTRSEDLLHV